MRDSFIMRVLFLMLFFSFTLYAWDMGGGGSSFGGGGSDDSKQFDAWNYWIGDENNLPKKEDRNISTKIVEQGFTLSLAGIDKDDTQYEKKDAKAGELDIYVEVAVYTNLSSPERVSNIIKWNPTVDKYIEKSDELTISKAYKDLVIGIEMCADYDDNKKYVIYNISSCSQSAECDEEGDKKLRTCYASNNFSVRPKKFQIEEINYLTSGQDYNLSVIAEDGNGDATQEYTLTNADVSSASGASSAVSKLISGWANGETNTDTKDYNLSLNIEKYMPNGDINNSLYGEGNITLYRFDNGDASDDTDDKYVDVYYTDVGNINLLLLDQNWSDVDKDDTPNGCSNKDGENMGRYICGDINVTYIPDHFTINNKIKFYDHNNSTFTYIAKDYNMSAHLEVEIEALNIDGNTTKNFDIDSWVHPMTIDFNTTNEVDINKSIIFDTNLSFEDGKITIKWNEQNISKNLLFNYKREVNSSQNPFRVGAKDTNISIVSRYGDFNISADNGTDIGGDDSYVTFLYARTNAPRKIFVKSDSYSVPLYYEVYCWNDDKSDCNKTLLPNGEDSNITDDPRWFINTAHNNSDNGFGKALNVTQKYGTGVDIKTQPTGDHQDSVILKYNGKLPYKTTMKNEASSWLIYRKYDATATTNEFQVEFNKGKKSSSWAGIAKEDVSNTNTDDVDITTRTNRRSMW